MSGKAVALLALIAMSCGAPPPPSPPGPTGAERVARQEGYLDGKKAQSEKDRATLAAKDAEIAALQAEVAELKRAEASAGQTANDLLACQDSLAVEQGRVIALQSAVDAKARAEEVARARALGPAGRKRELAECHRSTMLCDTLLSVFLEAASSDQERRTLSNLTSQPEGQPRTSPVRVERAPELVPDSQPCCKVCRKGYACGNSCISRSKQCHRPPGCACDG